MFDNIAFRIVCFVGGAVLLAVSSCGACEKVSEEGWNGPSSQPGAVHNRGPKRK